MNMGGLFLLGGLLIAVIMIYGNGNNHGGFGGGFAF